MGVTTIYAKTHLRSGTFEPKLWDHLYHPIYEGFLIIRIQNVCEKAILMCLIPILVGVIIYI